MYPESFLSKYEAFLTNTTVYKWNQNLVYLGLAVQIINAVFMIITALSIKIFFRLRRKQHGKPKIKNTISFKRLNLVYSLGLICTAGLHASFMGNQNKDSYLAHITVTLVINIMLLTLILTDNEAREFFTLKLRNWMEEMGSI